VDRGGVSPLHQYFGDDGCNSWRVSLPVHLAGEVYCPVLRQLDGRRVYSETHSDTLCHLTWHLFQLCSRRGTELIPRHIPGKRNILADTLSRADHLVQIEWTLHQDVVRTLFGKWEAPTVDLFTTRLNKRLPLFYSPLPDDEALGVDSLSASWRALSLMRIPPTPLFLAVLNNVLGYDGSTPVARVPKTRFPGIWTLFCEIAACRHFVIF
jgi:hypothetical protein